MLLPCVYGTAGGLAVSEANPSILEGGAVNGRQDPNEKNSHDRALERLLKEQEREDAERRRRERESE